MIVYVIFVDRRGNKSGWVDQLSVMMVDLHGAPSQSSLDSLSMSLFMFQLNVHDFMITLMCCNSYSSNSCDCPFVVMYKCIHIYDSQCDDQVLTRKRWHLNYGIWLFLWLL